MQSKPSICIRTNGLIVLISCTGQLHCSPLDTNGFDVSGKPTTHTATTHTTDTTLSDNTTLGPTEGHTTTANGSGDSGDATPQFGTTYATNGGFTSDWTTGEPPPQCKPLAPYVVPYQGEGVQRAYSAADLEIDKDGAVVIAGTHHYDGSVTDPLVMKVHPGENSFEMLWLSQTFCSMANAGANDVALDDWGDIYISGYFYGPIDPCCDQDIECKWQGGWTPITTDDIFAVKLLGTSGNLQNWGGTHDPGGWDDAKDIAVGQDGSAVVVGHCEFSKSVMIAQYDETGVTAGGCYSTLVSENIGWGAEWLTDGFAVAGQFADVLAIDDAVMVSNGVEADGFFAVIGSSGPPVTLGGPGIDAVHSMTTLPDGRVVLGGHCSSGWSVDGEPCGMDRTPFVLTMNTDGDNMKRTILRIDRMGVIIDVQARADGEYILASGILSADLDVDGVGTGYATLLRTDTLEKIQEWTIEGAQSQVRSAHFDGAIGLLFGGTLWRPPADDMVLWKGVSFLGDQAQELLPRTIEPDGRSTDIFLIRECTPE